MNSLAITAPMGCCDHGVERKCDTEQVALGVRCYSSISLTKPYIYEVEKSASAYRSQDWSTGNTVICILVSFSANLEFVPLFCSESNHLVSYLKGKKIITEQIDCTE